MTRNEQSLFTSFAYAPRDFLDSLELSSRGAWTSAPSPRRGPLEDGQAGFLKMVRDPGSTLKLLLKP